MSSKTINNASVTTPKSVGVQTTSKGVVTALAAFLIWGCFPFYFKQLIQYNPFEIIGHRIIWTFVCLGLVLLINQRWGWIKLIKSNPRLLGITFISSVLIATNWLVYVWAVTKNQILEASLGYFISPLFGIMLSLFILKERLRVLQWWAIGFAVTSVVIQIIMLNKVPWISLLLAGTFSIYGVMQRRTPFAAIDALFLETVLLTPICVIGFMLSDVASSSLSLWFSSSIWFLMLAGPITLVPLLLFNISTKMVAFSILSFMNYLTPTFIFLLAVFYYKEPFSTQRLMVFSLIWIGLIIFSIDLWQNRPSKLLKNNQYNTNN